MPKLNDEAPESIALLSQYVECEVLSSIDRHFPADSSPFDNWLLTYQITDEASETTGAEANPLTWLVPSGLDKLTVGANLSTERNATVNGKATYNLRLNKKERNACDADKPGRMSVAPQLTIDRWIEKMTKGSRPAFFSYSDDVVLILQGGVGSGITHGKFEGAFAIGGTRKLNKNINYSFVEINNSPQEVYVVNWPSSFTTKQNGKQPSSGSRRATSAVDQNAVNFNLLQLQGQQLDKISRDR